MSMPALDHLVIDVRERLDQAAETYRALGFQLTDRGYHTLGSANHLAMFQTNYLELLGMGRPGSPIRPELLAFPPGLNGLVLATTDADAQYRDLTARGVGVLSPQSFSRPVELDGVTRDAHFRTTHLEPAEVPFGRLYFCQHNSRELVWRPEWQLHPNGATAITAIRLSAADPALVAGLFRRMFDAEPARDGDTPGLAGSPIRLRMGGRGAGPVAIEIASHAAMAQQLGDALPEANGRAAFLAAIRLRTVSLQKTRDALQGVAGITTDDSIRVPAAEACNVALEFTG